MKIAVFYLAVVLLWSAVITFFCATVVFEKSTTKFYKGTIFGRPLFSEKRKHVKVKLEPNTKVKEMFHLALKQVHQLLGEKRDYIDVFDDLLLRRRKEHVSELCTLVKNGTSLKPNLAYYPNANMIYCRVPKVATKFLERMIQVLSTDDYISPFEFLRADEVPNEFVLNKYTQTTLDTAFKFVFARDPYKRIYSSYLDKFLTPNGLWTGIGKEIISFSRASPSEKSLECGHDVTFGELVKYLIARDPRSFNEHFMPVSTMCDVCYNHFDLIGKAETLKHDIMYILNATDSKRIIFKDFAEETSIHYILFNAMRTFYLTKTHSQCVSRHAAHLRLWRQLQIAGLIDKYDSCPLTPEDSDQANLTTVVNLLLDAYHRSTSTAPSNKKEAYFQAYSEVTLEDMEKLRVKYLNDLTLFDYDDRPKELFGSGRSNFDKLGGHFDYFDVLKLT